MVTSLVHVHIGGVRLHGHSGSGESPAPAPPGLAVARGMISAMGGGPRLALATILAVTGSSIAGTSAVNNPCDTYSDE